MQITLNEAEIAVAVKAHVMSQINIADDQEITVDFTAGRGGNGMSATLDIVPASAPKAAKTPAKTTPQKRIKAVTAAEPEPDLAPEPEKVSNISSGEERVDPDEQTEPADPPVEEVAETEPAPKAKSIFSKAKATAS